MPMTSKKPRFTGYWWEAIPGVIPQIVSVTESVCEAGYVAATQTTHWHLDYSYTIFGNFRVGKQRKWQTRGIHEGHLYAPGVVFSEDTRPVPLAVTRSIFGMFTGGEHIGLRSHCDDAGFAVYRDPQNLLGEALEKLLAIALHEGEGGFWRAQTQLSHIISLLHDAKQIGDGIYQIIDMPANASSFVEQVQNFLLTHLEEHLTRDKIADHFNQSVSAFAHRYREEAGESPIATLIRLRVNLAKSLLVKGYRLKVIAAKTGFTDEFHLSRTFKALEGISPSQFRAHCLDQE
jgi:AraC-like DNA-binding protein